MCSWFFHESLVSPLPMRCESILVTINRGRRLDLKWHSFLYRLYLTLHLPVFDSFPSSYFPPGSHFARRLACNLEGSLLLLFVLWVHWLYWHGSEIRIEVSQVSVVACLIMENVMGASIANAFANSAWRINVDEYHHLLREQASKEECCREISFPV